MLLADLAGLWEVRSGGVGSGDACQPRANVVVNGDGACQFDRSADVGGISIDGQGRLEHEGLIATAESTNELLVWSRGEDPVQTWVRLQVQDVSDDEAQVLQNSDEGAGGAEEAAAVQKSEDLPRAETQPPRRTEDILHEAADNLKIDRSRVKPMLHTLVDENWLETASDLAALSGSDREKYKIPDKLWKEVERILARASGPGADAEKPPTKRRKVELPEMKIKSGDLLECAGVAVLIETITAGADNETAKVDASVAYKGTSAGSTLIVFEAHGVYKAHHMRLLPTRALEGSLPTRALEGKFDARFSSVVFNLKPADGMRLTLTRASTRLERRTAGVSVQEQLRVARIEETAGDRATVQQAAQKLAGALCAHTVPCCAEWLSQVQAETVEKRVAPQVLITGPMGVGKSYLISSICGALDVCPSDCATGRAVSATSVGVSFRPFQASRDDGPGEWLVQLREPLSNGAPPGGGNGVAAGGAHGHKRYGARIEKYTPEEWAQEEAQHVENITDFWMNVKGCSSIPKRRPNDSEHGATESFDKLACVYGKENLLAGRAKCWKDAAAFTAHLKQRARWNPVVKALCDGDTVIEDNNLSIFKGKLKKWVRTAASPATATDLDRAQFWPVVRRVRIEGPFPHLRGIGELVDSAGKGDSNTVRAAQAVRDERSADVVCIVTEISRCASNGIVRTILGDQLRTALMRADGSDISFIATKADSMNQREVVRTLGLPATASFAECVQARNKHVKATMLGEIQQMMTDMCPEEDRDFTWYNVNVYTVACKPYMALRGCEEVGAPEQQLQDVSLTEVPALIEYLQLQALKWGNRAMSRQLLALAQVSKAIGAQLSSQESEAMAKTAAKAAFISAFAPFKRSFEKSMGELLDKAVRFFLDKLKERVTEGRDKARRGAPGCHDRWKGIHHSSYRATVKKDGVHSGTGASGKQDWPAEVSRLCYDTFQPLWQEFFGMHMKAYFSALNKTVMSSVNNFHKGLAEKIPNVHNIKEGIRIQDYLERQRLEVEENMKDSQHELADEVVDHVRSDMKSRCFSGASALSKGTGATNRMKEHMESTITKVNWRTATEGLEDGIGDLQENLEELHNKVVEDVPKLLEAGYKLLWQQLSNDELEQWKKLREEVLPVAVAVSAEAEQLLSRLREREAIVAPISGDVAGTGATTEDSGDADSDEASDAEGAKEARVVAEAAGDESMDGEDSFKADSDDAEGASVSAEAAEDEIMDGEEEASIEASADAQLKQPADEHTATEKQALEARLLKEASCQRSGQ